MFSSVYTFFTQNEIESEATALFEKGGGRGAPRLRWFTLKWVLTLTYIYIYMYV